MLFARSAACNNWRSGCQDFAFLPSSTDHTSGILEISSTSRRLPILQDDPRSSGFSAMASSRIFIKGLPPTLTEAEFKLHFSAPTRGITDAKIFPNRRIGYVGYKTAEDAQKAVKYFNKTFIRMSRIGVELARPVQDATRGQWGGTAPTAGRTSDGNGEVREENALKRKRDSRGLEEDNPELKEFLQVMKPKSRKKAWEGAEMEPIAQHENPSQGATIAVEEDQSDAEYEDVPKNTKGSMREPEITEVESQRLPPDSSHVAYAEIDSESTHVEELAEEPPNANSAVSDSDWARSRTSRLLGLLDQDEEEADAQPRDEAMSDATEDNDELTKGATKATHTTEAESSMTTPPLDARDEPQKPTGNSDTEAMRSSMRLFVRNLPYDVVDQDLEAEFESFGNLEEVGYFFLFGLAFLLEDDYPDRDS